MGPWSLFLQTSCPDLLPGLFLLVVVSTTSPDYSILKPCIDSMSFGKSLLSAVQIVEPDLPLARAAWPVFCPLLLASDSYSCRVPPNYRPLPKPVPAGHHVQLNQSSRPWRQRSFRITARRYYHTQFLSIPRRWDENCWLRTRPYYSSHFQPAPRRRPSDYRST